LFIIGYWGVVYNRVLGCCFLGVSNCNGYWGVVRLSSQEGMVTFIL